MEQYPTFNVDVAPVFRLASDSNLSTQIQFDDISSV